MLLTVIASGALLVSSPMLGSSAARCRVGETGPAVIVRPIGLKDRRGSVRVEVYPDDERDFLADDNLLVAEGKTFRRVVAELPAKGAVAICVRLPHAGSYTMSVVHDRIGNPRFSIAPDGIGFPGNPHIGWGRPKASAARFIAGPGITDMQVTLNYWHGLSFKPMASTPDAKRPS